MKVQNLRIWLMVVTGLIATLAWDLPMLLPFKYLTVLLHEYWHGFTAMIGGAALEKVSLSVEESGRTLISGLDGSAAFIFSVSAGYTGSALTGALLLRRGLQGGMERLTLLTFGGLLLYMSFLFTEFGRLAFLVGMGWSVVILIAILLGRKISSSMLVVLGTLFIWYSLYDMYDFSGDDIRNTDAWILAEYLQQNEWPGFSSSDSLSTASLTISVAWCLMMTLGAVAIIWPVLKPVFYIPPPVVEEEEVDESFPGEVTPEVMEWLMVRGLGPDGKPLPPELLETVPPGEIPVYNGELSRDADPKRD